jgi:hypothetical protein
VAAATTVAGAMTGTAAGSTLATPATGTTGSASARAARRWAVGVGIPVVVVVKNPGARARPGVMTRHELIAIGGVQPLLGGGQPGTRFAGARRGFDAAIVTVNSGEHSHGRYCESAKARADLLQQFLHVPAPGDVIRPDSSGQMNAASLFAASAAPPATAAELCPSVREADCKCSPDCPTDVRV